MIPWFLAVALCYAGEQEDFVKVATHEMKRRCPDIADARAELLANEIWASSVAANTHHWYAYPIDPRWLVTRGCIESNWHNHVADKSKVTKQLAPMQHWSVGYFHIKCVPWIIDAEMLEIGYHYPIREYILEHPKQQVWVANHFQARWLDHYKGNVNAMIEVYFYGGQPFVGKGTSDYARAFKKIYREIWGVDVQKRVTPF